MEAIFPEILLPIRKELELIDKQISKEMVLKAGHVTDFTHLDLNWWDKYIHPAVLVLSARMFGYDKPQITNMACVVQFIHLATGIHYEEYDNRPGLPVLIGDYFYAKFFSYLCEGMTLEWLPVLSQVICDIHDAGVREVEQHQIISSDVNAYISLLKKQASLLGICSEFGVLATNKEKRFQKNLETFGLNLSVAFKLIRSKRYLSVADQLLSEAKHALETLPDGTEKKIFGQLIDYGQQGLRKICLVG